MPRVFLIAQPTVTREGKMPNLEPLAEHGEIRTLLQAGLDNPWSEPARCMKIINARLLDFNPEEDSIAWAGGDSLALLMVGAVLERYGYNKVRWLRYERTPMPGGGWSHEGAKYIPTVIPLYHGSNGERAAS